MTNRNRKFVLNICKGLSHTQAAIQAGYKKETAAVTATRLLKRPEIKDKIEAFFKKESEDLDLMRANVLKENSILAHSDIGDIIDLKSDGTFRIRDFAELGPARKAIRSVKVKVKGVKKKRTFPRWAMRSRLSRLNFRYGISLSPSVLKRNYLVWAETSRLTRSRTFPMSQQP